MNLQALFEASGIELPLPKFRPHLDYFPELSLLIFLLEDIGYISRWVNDILCVYRHPCDGRFVGIEFWLHYNPHRLLPAPA